MKLLLYRRKVNKLTLNLITLFLVKLMMKKYAYFAHCVYVPWGTDIDCQPSNINIAVEHNHRYTFLGNRDRINRYKKDLQQNFSSRISSLFKNRMRAGRFEHVDCSNDSEFECINLNLHHEEDQSLDEECEIVERRFNIDEE